MDGFRQLLESDMKKSAMVNFFNKKFMHKNIILDPNDNKLSFGYQLFMSRLTLVLITVCINLAMT